MANCREGCGRPCRQAGGRTDPVCEECYRALLARVREELRAEAAAAARGRRPRSSSPAPVTEAA
jgi:hypothetical protein